MRGEDGELLTYPQALEKAVSAIVHGVGKEPGELKLEGINTRADILKLYTCMYWYSCSCRIPVYSCRCTAVRVHAHTVLNLVVQL